MRFKVSGWFRVSCQVTGGGADAAHAPIVLARDPQTLNRVP